MGDPDEVRWVARAGLLIWAVLVAAVVLNGYVVIAEAVMHGGFFTDRFVLPMICGLIAAGALAVATSGLQLRGGRLAAIDILTERLVAPGQIAEVEDVNGLTLVLRDGRRIQPYVCQQTWAQQLNRNTRRRVGGALVREWIEEHDGGSAAPEGRRPRWLVILGVPAWALFSGVLTVALHAVVV